MIERLVDVGGFRLFMREMGDKSPTVILEGGIGGTISYWRYVQPQVAKMARVISYDRPGNGKSQKSPNIRDCKSMSDELHTLLQNSGVQPPYVLVCASYGGFVGRTFASCYPDELVGMVLVEPTHEDFMEGMKKNRSQKEWIDYMQSAEHIISLSSEGTKEEWKYFGHNLQEIRKYDFPEQLPVIIITSNRLGDREKSLMHLKNEDIELKYGLHKNWTINKSNIKQVVTMESGHDIAIELPDLVIESIKNLQFFNREELIWDKN